MTKGTRESSFLLLQKLVGFDIINSPINKNLTRTIVKLNFGESNEQSF